MVRAKRAIDELCSTLPITGTFSSTRSAVYCSLGERLYAYMKAKNAASATPSISHHHPTNMSDMPNTSAVKAGRSAPKLANCSLKIGTTYTIRMRSEEHTSELQSLMRNSYAVF